MGLPEPITLAPGDIEIEYTNAGPIIHIFPEEKDPHDVIDSIIQGIYLVHKSHCDKNKYAEASEYAQKFMSKMKHK